MEGIRTGGSEEPRLYVHEVVQSDPSLDVSSEGVVGETAGSLGHVAIAVELPSDGNPPVVPGPELYIG